VEIIATYDRSELIPDRWPPYAVTDLIEEFIVVTLARAYFWSLASALVAIVSLP